MKRKTGMKLLAMLVVLCLVLPLAAACSSNPTGGSGGDKASGEKVHLKLYMQPQDDAAQGSKDEFEWQKKVVEEKFPNIEFEWTRMAPGTDYRQQYDKLLLAGDGPTVWAGLPYVDIQSRIKNKTIADITSYVQNWQLKKDGKVIDIFDEALSTKDGKWYAVPFSPYVSGMSYNKQAIEAAGGDASVQPKTWEEFAKLAQQYTDPSVPRFGYTLLGSDYAAWPFTPWVWSAGGEMVRPNDDGTYSVAFNEDPGVDAAMFMHDLVNVYHCTQTNILENYDDMQMNMTAGRACYGWGTPSWYAPDQLAKYDQKQENFGFYPIPGKTEDKQVAFAGGEVWTMNPKDTKEQMDAAWDFIQFFSYDEQFLTDTWKLENDKGIINANSPARSDLIDKKYSMATAWPSHWAGQYAAAMKVAKPEPFCPDWNSLKDEIVPYLQKIITTEKISRDEVKAQLDACADLLYQKYPDSFKKP